MKAGISPGPGAPYNVEKAIKLYKGKISPRLTIGKKFGKDFNKTSSIETPGPGAYDNTIKE